MAHTFKKRENISTGTLSGLAVKAASSGHLGLCHPQICCKLNPDSFSTYKQLCISAVAYKALALTQAVFLTAVLKTSCNNPCPSGFKRPVLALPVASA